MSGRPWLIAVTVDGVNLPRFLRRAGEMGLLLTGVRIRGKHLSAFAREDDVMTLRMMAENGGWRFSVGNRQGTGRLMTWIRHRLALLSALMLGIGELIGASQVMWRVEIENAGIYAADLPEYLQALGITPPMRKSDCHLIVMVIQNLFVQGIGHPLGDRFLFRFCRPLCLRLCRVLFLFHLIVPLCCIPILRLFPHRSGDIFQ